MTPKKLLITLVSFLILLSNLFFVLYMLRVRSPKNKDIRITDIKMANGLDEKLMPVKVIEVFPKGTMQVYCWLRWKDAKVNTEIIARWHYVTDDIPILDYTFGIPRKEGAGGVRLSMPEGKIFPPGLYKISLVNKQDRLLKSLTFKIE